MTSVELLAVFEAAVAKLSKADRVLWLRFFAATPRTLLPRYPKIIWDHPNGQVAIGEWNTGTIYARVPSLHGDGISGHLGPVEAAQYVIGYLREHYAAVACSQGAR